MRSLNITHTHNRHLVTLCFVLGHRVQIYLLTYLLLVTKAPTSPHVKWEVSGAWEEMPNTRPDATNDQCCEVIEIQVIEIHI